MSDFWFPWYPALYRLKTLHLTPEQDGIYRRLIDHYMESAQPLPDNIAAICRIAGCDSHAIGIPLAFFTHTEGIGYTHKTCDSVLADIHERHVKRHGAAKAGAHARWKHINKLQVGKCDSHAIGNAVAMRSDATLTLTPTNKERGSRFALAQLPDEWKAYCLKERPDLNAESVFMDFHDHWVAVPGAKGLKLDWLATWRGWVRRQHGNKAKPQKQTKGLVV